MNLLESSSQNSLLHKLVEESKKNRVVVSRRAPQ